MGSEHRECSRGLQAVNNWVNATLGLGCSPTRSIFYLQTLDMDKWEMHADAECLLCAAKPDPAASDAPPTSSIADQ